MSLDCGTTEKAHTSHTTVQLRADTLYGATLREFQTFRLLFTVLTILGTYLYSLNLSGGGTSVLPQKQLARHSGAWRHGEFLWRHSGAWRHGSGLWRHGPLWRHGRACGGTARCGDTGRPVATRPAVVTWDRPVATWPAVVTWDRHVATQPAVVTGARPLSPQRLPVFIQ